MIGTHFKVDGNTWNPVDAARVKRFMDVVALAIDRCAQAAACPPTLLKSTDRLMNAVLGMDIGTTSTIGILVGLRGEILATASRPVTLASPQAGWAEEDPGEWWENVRAIVAELLALRDCAGRHQGGRGHGMLPGRGAAGPGWGGDCARASSRATGVRLRSGGAARRMGRGDFLARAGNGINQQLVTAKLRWIERHEPAVFARIATVFGSYDYINYRLTSTRAVEQNWALEAGFVNVSTGLIDRKLVALAHIGR